MNARRARSRSTASHRQQLLQVLADGRFHSGQEIAGTLGVSRSAVWKHLQWLRTRGIEVRAFPRRGYSLALPVQLLERDLILNVQSAEAAHRLARLEVLLEVDSTNRYLGDMAPPPPGRAAACLAEIQTAGRGRRGRVWLAPFGSSLSLSIAWLFAELPTSFSALGLAIGATVARALSTLGARDVGLKWPNDVVWRRKKLGGILIEVHGQAEGGTCVIIGVGLNVRMPAATRLRLAEHHAVAATDLHEVMGTALPERNVLAAALLDAVPAALSQFETSGFAPFMAEWQARDVACDLPVKLLSGTQIIRGVARGVAEDGALLLDADGRVQRYVSGEISLRLE